MTDRTSVAVVIGQHRKSGASDTDISLTLNWSFGDAPNAERAIADTQTKAYRIAFTKPTASHLFGNSETLDQSPRDWSRSKRKTYDLFATSLEPGPCAKVMRRDTMQSRRRSP